MVLGRVVAKDGVNYTVTSESSRGEIHVWNPEAQTLLRFAGREEFEHWAYGAPVPSRGVAWSRP